MLPPSARSRVWEAPGPSRWADATPVDPVWGRAQRQVAAVFEARDCCDPCGGARSCAEPPGAPLPPPWWVPQEQSKVPDFRDGPIFSPYVSDPDPRPRRIPLYWLGPIFTPFAHGPQHGPQQDPGPDPQDDFVRLPCAFDGDVASELLVHALAAAEGELVLRWWWAVPIPGRCPILILITMPGPELPDLNTPGPNPIGVYLIADEDTQYVGTGADYGGRRVLYSFRGTRSFAYVRDGSTPSVDPGDLIIEPPEAGDVFGGGAGDGLSHGEAEAEGGFYEESTTHEVTADYTLAFWGYGASNQTHGDLRYRVAHDTNPSTFPVEGLGGHIRGSAEVEFDWNVEDAARVPLDYQWALPTCASAVRAPFEVAYLGAASYLSGLAASQADDVPFQPWLAEIPVNLASYYAMFVLGALDLSVLEVLCPDPRPT